MASMDAGERRRLIAAYIEHFTAAYHWERDGAHWKEQRRGQEHVWAFRKFDAIARTDPDLCLDLILQMLRAPRAASVDANLAAGPLEVVLARFGPEIMDDVEALSRSHAEFRKLLGGVWRSAMTDEVWARVESCRSEPG